jgi:hypothetical protein
MKERCPDSKPHMSAYRIRLDLYVSSSIDHRSLNSWPNLQER